MAAGMAAALPSCESTPYETGDGGLSYMRADYADITVRKGVVTSIITDDNMTLFPPEGLSVSASMPRDTLLRALLHYNLREQTSPIELLRTTPVTVLTPHDRSEITGMKTDPVKLISMWKSRNGRYINLHLGVMCGNSEAENGRQLIQIVRDSIHTAGRAALFLSLYHDQAGIPEYYTEELHISLSTRDLTIPYADDPTMQPDTVCITMRTYDGTVTKKFITSTDNHN